MNTRVCPASADSLSLAARLLADGALVAFPTETVYGLGANALDADAVLSIFAAKGRPADNPLIVHIHDTAQLEGLCEIPPMARPLMDAFWPGPLTILMPRTPRIPDCVTASLPTVAVRMPSHPVARDLLKACNLPIAAPSANRSGKPSPTTAQHVLEDMQGRIPLILDGGPCEVGLESTVIDICHGTPVILRPGGITKAQLESVLGTVDLAPSILRPLGKNEVALSPGMRYRHYAPEGAITLVTGSEEEVLQALPRLYSQAVADGKTACVLCFHEHMEALRACHPHDLGSRLAPQETAHRLFDVLRELDAEHMDCIYSEVLPPEGVGLAVMNRLGRAAAFHTLAAKDAGKGADKA
ncbi:MAG: threonylcarbamoyl-AMP synthase [Clostridia bacterium]|nr:threonylcarbamoyl-AMP synthase [Clostridia bacterium]